MLDIYTSYQRNNIQLFDLFCIIKFSDTSETISKPQIWSMICSSFCFLFFVRGRYSVEYSKPSIGSNEASYHSKFFRLVKLGITVVNA